MSVKMTRTMQGSPNGLVVYGYIEGEVLVEGDPRYNPEWRQILLDNGYAVEVDAAPTEPAVDPTGDPVDEDEDVEPEIPVVTEPTTEDAPESAPEAAGATEIAPTPADPTPAPKPRGRPKKASDDEA